MRISVYDDYSDNKPMRLLKKVALIYLNGEMVKNVTVADEEAGFIEQYEMDEKGRIVIDPISDEPALVIRKGEVEIRTTIKQGVVH